MRSSPHHDRQPHRRAPRETGEEVLTEEMLAALAATSPAAPDLTHRVLGRLGYMRVTPEVGRRVRGRRRARRAVMCLSGGLLIAAALAVHEQGSNARRPHGPTIPAAIGNDIQRHHQRLRRTIHTIRGWTPAWSTESGSGSEGDPDPEPLDSDVDRSGLGPVRWI